MQRPNWFEWILDHPWSIELFLLIFILFFFNVVLKRILRPPAQQEIKETHWRAHLEYAIASPLRILLWILAFSFGFDLLTREFKLEGFSYIPLLRNAGIILCVAWVLLRWKRVFQRVALTHPRLNAKGRMALDPFTVEMVAKIFTVLTIFVSMMLVMSIFGLNVAPLVAFGGIGAAVLGISGKDVIANFFGGFMIYLTRPFAIGDQIQLQQRNILGHVEEIGWYFTSIRDLQKKPVYIPNAVFSTEPLVNHSRMTHRRIEEVVGVRYEDLGKLAKINADIRHLLETHVKVDNHLPYTVFLDKFGDVALQIEIKAYILSTNYDAFMAIRQEILQGIYRIIHNAGAEIPYPTMHVKLEPERI